MRPVAPAPLEHHDHHAVGGADAEQVQERGLERHEHRPERTSQQQERQQDHGGDQHGKRSVHPVRRHRRSSPSGRRRGLERGCHRATAGNTSAAEPLDGVHRRVVLRCGGRERDERGDAGLGVHLGRRDGRDPGRLDGGRQWAGRRSASSRMSTAITSGPLSRPEAVGDEIVGPTFGPSTRAACRRRGSPGAATAPVRPAPAAGRCRRSRTPRRVPVTCSPHRSHAELARGATARPMTPRRRIRGG